MQLILMCVFVYSVVRVLTEVCSLFSAWVDEIGEGE